MKIQLVKKFLPFAMQKARYKVAHGGRGGAKSWQIAAILLLKGRESRLSILCAREVQKSIAHSSYKLVVETIERLGLRDFYEIQKTTITGANGTEFIFAGLHDAEALTSYEGVDIVWIEEARRVKKETWKYLVPTIRKPGSEIWLTFNPGEDSDFIYQLFVANEPPPNSIVIQVNYTDNPFFPDVLEGERRHCEATDPDLHAHIWLGQTEKNSQAQVFAGKWVVREFPDPKPGTILKHGVDWGFGAHPTAFVRCWEQDGELFVRCRHVYHAESIADIPEYLLDWRKDSKDWTLRCDPADPSAIRYIRGKGFLAKKASKPPGSIKAGIRFLRSYKRIVLHPEDAEMIEEARLYKYKVDPLTGDVTPIILDAYNHGWDALRYAKSVEINRGLTAADMETEDD